MSRLTKAVSSLWPRSKNPQTQKRPQIVGVVDVENIKKNTVPTPGSKESFFVSGFLRIMGELKRIGEVVAVLVFAPTHLIAGYEEFLREQGCFIINCPKKHRNQSVLPDEPGEDTVDPTLICFCQTFLARMEGITHVCLFSGDHHFGPMLKKLKAERKIKVFIAAGDRVSLTSEAENLIDLAEWDETKTRKMIFFFKER